MLRGGAQVELRWLGEPAEIRSVLARLDGGEWKVLRHAAGDRRVIADLPRATADSLELALGLARGERRWQVAAGGRRALDAHAPTTPARAPRYVSSSDVELAVEPRDRGRAGVARVRLYYQAAAGELWELVRDEPVGADFSCEVVWRLRLKRDGAYAFTSAAVDALGHAEPAPRPTDPPRHPLTLDRTPPVVIATLGPIGDDGSREVSWSTEDAAVDPASARVLRARSDGGWDAVAEGQPATGRLRVDGGAGALRVEVADLAGNRGVGETEER